MKQLVTELVVVGGGVSGALAAIAAARNGVDTLLVEREACLGGTGVAGMFQDICGLYLNGDEFPTETLNNGITGEIVSRLQSPVHPGIRKVGQVYVHPFSGRDLAETLTGACLAEKRLKLLFCHSATAVDADAGNIKNVTLNSPSGEVVVSPGFAIDCSGSGVVAAMAYADYELAPAQERQLAGFVVRITGLEGNDDALEIKVPYYCARGVSLGILPPALKFTTFTPGTSPDEGFCKLSIEGEEGAERDHAARIQAAAMLNFLSQHIPAFGSAIISETSPRVMDREGRRITGDYILSEEDVLSARKFSDGVVKNSWPIELWDSAKGTEYRYLPQGDYYEIPLRCLKVKGFNNLMTAGRCISVSRTALGSTRVMGTCMSLGEQAGLAAARFIKGEDASRVQQ